MYMHASDDELDLNEGVSQSVKERKDDVEIRDYNRLPDFVLTTDTAEHSKKQHPDDSQQRGETATVITVHETIMSHGCLSVCSSGATHTAHSPRVCKKSVVVNPKEELAKVKIKQVSNKSQNDTISSFLEDPDLLVINPLKFTSNQLKECEAAAAVLSKQLKSASSASASEESENSSSEDESFTKQVTKETPTVEDNKSCDRHPLSQRGRKRKMLKSEIKYPFQLKRRKIEEEGEEEEEEEEEDTSKQEIKDSFESKHISPNDKHLAEKSGSGHNVKQCQQSSPSPNIDLAIHNPLNFTAQQLSECREKAAVISQNLKSSESSSEDSNNDSSAEGGDTSFPKYSFAEALSLYDALRSAEGCGVGTPDTIGSRQVPQQEHLKVGNASTVRLALVQPQSVSTTELSCQMRERSSKCYNSGVSLSQQMDSLNKPLSSARQQLIENEALLARTAQLFQYEESSITCTSSSQDDCSTKAATRPHTSVDYASTPTTRNVSASNSKTSNATSSTTVLPNASHSDTETESSSAALASDQSASESSASSSDTSEDASSDTSESSSTSPTEVPRRGKRKMEVTDGRDENENKRRKIRSFGSSTALTSGPVNSEPSLQSQDTGSAPQETSDDTSDTDSSSSVNSVASALLSSKRKIDSMSGRDEACATKKIKATSSSGRSTTLASDNTASSYSSTSSSYDNTSKEDGSDASGFKPSSVVSDISVAPIRKRKMDDSEERDDTKIKKKRDVKDEIDNKNRVKPEPSVSTREIARPSCSSWFDRTNVRRGPEQPHVIRRRLRRLQEKLDGSDGSEEEVKQRKKQTNSGL